MEATCFPQYMKNRTEKSFSRDVAKVGGFGTNQLTIFKPGGANYAPHTTAQNMASDALWLQ
jgi:hypothetical protein